MDRTTERLWREGLPPFDGLTLATPALATTDLHAAASRLVGLLRGTYEGTTLSTAEDWHEHDGFVSEPVAASWEDLEDAMASEDALRSWSPDDTDVRRAWHADDAFYLRWFLYDEGDSPLAIEPSAGGELDLTGSRDLIAEALQALRGLGVEPEIEPATQFFNRRWNG